MIHNPGPEYDMVIIHPGEYYASDSSIQIKTLLGSCVAACLYDPINGVAGMNHFLLSMPKYKDRKIILTDSGRYGIQAMELLINDMIKKGARKKYIKAKVFGGANVLNYGEESALNIGEINTRFILDFLENEKIPLIAQSLGGGQGRIVHFFTDTFKVLVRNIKQQRKMVVNEEKAYLKKAIQRKEKPENNVELWLDNH